MSIIYATPEELARYIEPDAAEPQPVKDATVLLRHASGLVTDAISGAVYATTAEGLPTLQSVLKAVKDATCEQAQAWALNGIDPRKGTAALKPIVTTKALAGASVSYGQSADVQQAIVDLASGLSLTAPAYLILENAGLITNRVGTARNTYTRPLERINR